MTYRARSGVIGKYTQKPFVGFVLSSRSEPDRSLLLDEEAGRVWVAPGEGLRRQIAESPYKAVENLYPCIVAFHDKRGSPAAVSFNGRMSIRIEEMMQRTSKTAESSLRQTLQVFPPKPGDPRIGAVLRLSKGGCPSFCLGVYDKTGQRFYLSVANKNVTDGTATYVSTANPRNAMEIGLDGAGNPDELARQLFDKILGIPAESGCGSAVCMISEGNFEYGLYLPGKQYA